MFIDPDAEDSPFDCFEDDSLDVNDFYFVFGEVIWEAHDIKLLTDFEVNNQECLITCGMSGMELHFLNTLHLGSWELPRRPGVKPPYEKNESACRTL